ncbi:ACT domain-containing protein [Serpentinicella sp. ANB-PHB4]|uniref:ACT domain-containing protein n=1 Tax=Serpentinicella sp. ANB-PHB4 TaxID=3074076 RepID=UPI00285E10F6|nr:ACT domain-containing protein [Serpentinicella sp. ANB-PHB4]MDR5659152.1 ACT domain-containing protein [Serpentinicella sp. ANB-PHB4]
MINTEEDTYYIVNAKALPEVFIKTMEAKELLKRGGACTIYEAVEKVGISRGAYYKYKDYIFPFYELGQGKIITFSFLLDHSAGILSEVLNKIADAGGSILTINQNIPNHGVANVTITVEVKNLVGDIELLVKRVKESKGVKEVDILGKE